MPVAIIGMHRSGTSMVARLLNIAGLDLGRSDVLVPPSPFNKAGHWEHAWFVSLNERLLRTLGGTWYQPPLPRHGWVDLPEVKPLLEEARVLIASTFGVREDWGWKDPRTTILLPFWQRVVPNLRFVVCVRNPLSVADSLRARDEVPTASALALWQLYTESALRDSAGQPRVIVHYESFFREPVAALAPALALAGCTEARNDAEREAAMTSIVKRELQHYDWSLEDVLSSQTVPVYTRLLYETLLNQPEMLDHLLTKSSGDRFGKQLQPLAEYDRHEMYAQIERGALMFQARLARKQTEALSARLSGVQQQRDALTVQLAMARRRLASIENRTSFRLLERAWRWQLRIAPPGTPQGRLWLALTQVARRMARQAPQS